MTLAKLKRNSNIVATRQREASELSDRLEITISDLKLKTVTEQGTEIKEFLNSIDDAVSALGGELSDPSLSDLVSPDTDAAQQIEFQKIMAE